MPSIASLSNRKKNQSEPVTTSSSASQRLRKNLPNYWFFAAIAAGVCVVSLVAFWFLYQEGMTNLYLDGVAHVNIARKVIDHPDDSIWQRYIQIGTPWLPLQTVLIIPFVTNDWMWRTGIAGSLVSMISFVTAAVALYGLAANLYRTDGRLLPLVAVAAFVLNPSVLYMQATPMSELPFMAALAAAVYFFQRWTLQQNSRRLVLAGVTIALATLARYEAWPVAGAAAVLVALFSGEGILTRVKNAVVFSLPVVAGVGYWLWHNWSIYDEPLAFLIGPHSARGIFTQHQTSLGWAKAFVDSAPASLAIAVAAVAVCAGPLLVLLAIAGLFRLVKEHRRAPVELAPVALLAIPFLFHSLSLFRGEIQIFPFSAFGLLNVRYGVPHLLAVSLLVPAAGRVLSRSNRLRLAVVSVVIAAQYGLLLSEGFTQLAVHQEAYRNGVNSPSARELHKAAAFLIEHPADSVVLMYTGALGPLVSRGGLRFSQIIHEGTIRWHQIAETIPEDVFTIILQDGDPLDTRIRSSPGLEKDLRRRFRQRFGIGKIRIFELVGNETETLLPTGRGTDAGQSSG